MAFNYRTTVHKGLWDNSPERELFGQDLRLALDLALGTGEFTRRLKVGSDVANKMEDFEEKLKSDENINSEVQ